MRWERLFDELEGQVEHEHVRERDALVEELREGEWAQVSWTHLLADGSEAEALVRDVGLVAGTVTFANRHLVHLKTPTAEHIIATSAVVWVSGGQRPIQSSPVREALGWAHVLRAAGDDALRFALAGGQSVDGSVEVVGADFVRVGILTGGPAQAAGTRTRTTRLVPFSAIRMLTVLA